MGGKDQRAHISEALLPVVADRTDLFWSNERSTPTLYHLSVINQYMYLAFVTQSAESHSDFPSVSLIFYDSPIGSSISQFLVHSDKIDSGIVWQNLGLFHTG